MKRTKAIAVAVASVLASLSLSAQAHAGNGVGTQLSPPPTTTPSTQASVGTAYNEFDVGTIGAIAPIPPKVLQPPGSVNIHTAGTASPPPPPPCSPGAVPTGSHSTLAHKQNYIIYPTFTRNASGGYDGSDPALGYYQPNAIPAGGDPSQTQLGAPATAANVAGHVIAVPVTFNALVGASCTVGGLAFGTPYLKAEDPPSRPPPNVLADPPFALGAPLIAAVTGKWRIGTVATLPGPSPAAPTFVHIPTCAWLDSSVPLQPAFLHAIKATQWDGYTLFLIYNISVTPGPITWDWGDGIETTTLDALESGPPVLPSYDPSTQTWTNPCTVSHAYGVVSSGRTITATQSFNIDISVIWSDGVGTQTAAVSCDPATGGDCTVGIGAPQGWTSGPHPVDQIEPVPFSPTTGG